MALNADAILKHAGNYKVIEVHVPAWADESGDDVVRVRGMTMAELEINQAAQAAKGGEGQASASLVARCVVSESGARVFSDSQVGAISQLQVVEVEPILDAILTLSGLNNEGADAILGKSETTPTSEPSSESPGTPDASSMATEGSAAG